MNSDHCKTRNACVPDRSGSRPEYENDIDYVTTSRCEPELEYACGCDIRGYGVPRETGRLSSGLIVVPIRKTDRRDQLSYSLSKGREEIGGGSANRKRADRADAAGRDP